MRGRRVPCRWVVALLLADAVHGGGARSPEKESLHWIACFGEHRPGLSSQPAGGSDRRVVPSPCRPIQEPSRHLSGVLLGPVTRSGQAVALALFLLSVQAGGHSIPRLKDEDAARFAAFFESIAAVSRV